MQIEIVVSEGLETEALAAWGSVVSAQPGETAADRARRGILAMLRARIGEVARITAQSSVSSTVSTAQNAALGRVDAGGALAVNVP